MHWVEHRYKFIPLQGLWMQSTSFLQVVLLAGGEGLALGGPERSVSFWVTLPLARSWVRVTGMANCSTVNRDSHRLKRKRFLRAQPSALRFHFSPSPGPAHPFRARATLPVMGSREGCGWEGYGEAAEVPSWTTTWEFYRPLTVPLSP